VHVRKLAGGAPADPEEVARLIYDAVHDPQPRLRYLAGATPISSWRVPADGFEQFEQAMRGAMDGGTRNSSPRDVRRGVSVRLRVSAPLL
jgi:hypothetical protein